MSAPVPGTGLGLAIAKQAVELHGGDIEFASELNIGTTFQVTLPRYCRSNVLESQ